MLQTCNCGCGKQVNTETAKFIRGHNRRGKVSFCGFGENNPMYGRNCEKNPAWKGDLAGENAFHTWIWKLLGKADHCELNLNHKVTIYHWASLNHHYTRNPKDYIQLCPSCHINYDLGNISIRDKTILDRGGRTITVGKKGKRRPLTLEHRQKIGLALRGNQNASSRRHDCSTI